jgi:hypothetical protein
MWNVVSTLKDLGNFSILPDDTELADLRTDLGVTVMGKLTSIAQTAPSCNNMGPLETI